MEFRASSAPSNMLGGRRIRSTSSVQVTGSDFPVRRYTGTPFHRQESMKSLAAAKVSTPDAGATPGSLRYPRN